jgi:hypothetical protein
VCLWHYWWNSCATSVTSSLCLWHAATASAIPVYGYQRSPHYRCDRLCLTVVLAPALKVLPTDIYLTASHRIHVYEGAWFYWLTAKGIQQT